MGAQLLRAHGQEFTVIDETEAVLMISQLQSRLAIEREAEGLYTLDAEHIADYFARARALTRKELTLLEVLEQAPERYREFRHLLEELFELYQQEKKKLLVLDYTDILEDSVIFACQEVTQIFVACEFATAEQRI